MERPRRLWLASAVTAGFLLAHGSLCAQAVPSNGSAAENPAGMLQRNQVGMAPTTPGDFSGSAAERQRRAFEQAARLQRDASRLLLLTQRLQASVATPPDPVLRQDARKVSSQIAKLAKSIRSEMVQQ